MDAEGIFRLVYDHPAEIKAPLAQDVGLLPFEQIMSVFERIAPLTIASTERGENNMLSIDRITLGYMGTPMKDEPSRYQLIPVWDFFRHPFRFWRGVFTIPGASDYHQRYGRHGD